MKEYTLNLFSSSKNNQESYSAHVGRYSIHRTVKYKIFNAYVKHRNYYGVKQHQY
jgi:hypothetical protein